MIELNAPVQQDKMIEFLDGSEIEGVTFTFKEKKGMKLFFEVNSEDVEEAARTARNAIKAQPWGSVLYFQAVGIK
ncbi:hypothetical protein CBF35_10760 [Vagococcus salmoninarum]|uniref:Uncharacterized protein n=2 Tax=Vagococcus salmoninarum TaxID=2739 RepID=A0A429ZKJ3_9ENTE|nr:hypothetical protein [Vagococcus salmoninarum]RST94186.1 hypothetical protein CBF35_10760 [Vagococcus salmoninarum]